jgi:hypothetical protein
MLGPELQLDTYSDDLEEMLSGLQSWASAVITTRIATIQLDAISRSRHVVPAELKRHAGAEVLQLLRDMLETGQAQAANGSVGKNALLVKALQQLAWDKLHLGTWMDVPVVGGGGALGCRAARMVKIMRCTCFLSKSPVGRFVWTCS